MPLAAEVLKALRPAHLPPPPAGLTAGDILLPVLAGLLLALGLALFWPKPIRGRRRQAMRALDELAASDRLAPPEAAVARARLLRRIVRESDGEEAARLDGPQFAAHLDRRFQTDFFTNGAGRTLTISLYAPPDKAGDATAGVAASSKAQTPRRDDAAKTDDVGGGSDPVGRALHGFLLAMKA